MGKETRNKLQADDLEISFFFNINKIRFPDHSSDQLYQKQGDVIDVFRSIKAVIFDDPYGLTIIIRFNKTLEKHLNFLRDTLSLVFDLDIEDISIDYLFTDEFHMWADACPLEGEPGYYRLMTDEELEQFYQDNCVKT